MRLSRNQIKKQLKKKAILETAKSLFAQYGYRETKIEDIAIKTGIAVGTIYCHFENKEDIFLSLLKEKGLQLIQQLKKVSNIENSFQKKLKKITKVFLKFIENNEDFFKIVSSERCKLEENNNLQMRELLEIYQEYVKFINDTLKEGKKYGVLKKINTREMANYYLGLIETFVFYWLLNGKKGILRYKASFIVDLFFNGVKQRNY